jgi:hypothetical protein
MISQFSPRTLLGTSIVAIVFSVGFVLFTLPSFLSLALFGSRNIAEPREVMARLMEQRVRNDEAYRNRFIGRSIFFPPPHRQPPVPPADSQPQKKIEVVQTGPPDHYTGPSPCAMLGNEVWFKPLPSSHLPLVLHIGEEKDGVKLLAANPPWSIKVGHQGGEYNVTLFNDRTEQFLSAGGSHDRSELSDTQFPGLTEMPEVAR